MSQSVHRDPRFRRDIFSKFRMLTTIWIHVRMCSGNNSTPLKKATADAILAFTFIFIIVTLVIHRAETPGQKVLSGFPSRQSNHACHKLITRRRVIPVVVNFTLLRIQHNFACNENTPSPQTVGAVDIDIRCLDEQVTAPEKPRTFSALCSGNEFMWVQTLLSVVSIAPMWNWPARNGFVGTILCVKRL